MANSREKGAAFERQIARQISEHTGLPCRRNIAQYQVKCAAGDLSGEAVAGWAIECKRYAKARPSDWKAWRRQAWHQAAASGLKCALIVKLDRQPATVWVPVPGSDDTTIAEGDKWLGRDMEWLLAQLPRVDSMQQGRYDSGIEIQSSDQ